MFSEPVEDRRFNHLERRVRIWRPYRAIPLHDGRLSRRPETCGMRDSDEENFLGDSDHRTSGLLQIDVVSVSAKRAQAVGK